MENDNLNDEKRSRICDIMNDFQSDEWSEKYEEILSLLRDTVIFDFDDDNNITDEIQAKENKKTGKGNYFIHG